MPVSEKVVGISKSLNKKIARMIRIVFGKLIVILFSLPESLRLRASTSPKNQSPIKNPYPQQEAFLPITSK